MTKTTYKAAGVDIEAGNKLVDQIKTLAQETKRMEVISGIGGFAGLFSLQSVNVKDPVLVATTDGVGTKLKLAIESRSFDHIGQDLVAMCVNDLICCGAEPLFFLDYYATGQLQVDQAAAVINSISSSLKEINCSLLGGETAEMPGMYQKNDFDLAGFAVGIVDKNALIDGSSVGIGNKVIGLSSSGLHSNGYSLARKIIENHKLDLNKAYFSDTALGKALLTPTIIYAKPILNLLREFDIHAMAHITGGGLVENLPRVLPKQCKAVLDKNKINVPQIFTFLQETAAISDDEMWRVFNMGIGYVVVVSPDIEKAVLEQLAAMDVVACTIGTIEEKKDGDTGVEFG